MHGAADQGAASQNLQSLQNFTNAFRRGADVKLSKVVKDSVKVV
jgi:hypothetical protein